MKEEIGDYSNKIDNLLITGVGKIDATYSLTKELSKNKYDIVLNLGSCGAHGKDVYVGDMVYCEDFSTEITGLESLGIEEKTIYPSIKNLLPHIQHSSCITVSKFVSETSGYGEYPVVFDMESYALAKVCKLEGIPFVSYKFISDKLDMKDWQSSFLDCSNSLFTIYAAIKDKSSEIYR